MPCQDVSPIVASHHGAIAVYEFWPFDRSNWTNGKPAGFQLSWSNGSAQAQAGTQGISTLQSMAIEIGDRHKVNIPCCCCLPPLFTPGSVESTATEMNSGGFVAAAANATGLSTMVITEWVSASDSSNPYVFLILLPLAAESAMQAAHSPPPPPPPVAPSAPGIAPEQAAPPGTSS